MESASNDQARSAELAKTNTALKNSLDRLAANPDLNAFLGHVLLEIVQQFQVEFGYLFLYDADSQTLPLHLYIEHGQVQLQPEEIPASFLKPSIAHLPIWDTLLQTRQSFLITHDTAPRPVFQGTLEEQQQHQARINLLLTLRDEPIGLLSLVSTRRSFSPEELELAQALAHQVTLAIQLTRLAEEAKQAAVAREQEKAAKERVAQLVQANTILKKTIDVLATESDLDRSLGHVLQVITEHLRSPSAALWLTNPDGETFSLHLVYLNGSIVPAAPAYVEQLSGHWIRGRDLSRDLSLKTHIRNRAPVIYDLIDCPEITLPQRQFMERLGVHTLLGIPLLLNNEVVGSFTVRFTERRKFSAEELELTQTLAHQATLVIQLRQLAEEAKQTALLEERNRMAGEIHDTLAQAFTGISIQVGMAQKLVMSSPTDTQQILDRVLALAQTGLTEARRSVWALHSTANEYVNLAYNLQACLHHLTDGLPIQIELEMSGAPCLAPAIVGQNLLRIAQEAINNTVCHAQATQLWVKLNCEPSVISLSIRDNGRGFTPSVETGGFGLIGMSERASRLNGQFTLRSRPGQGTAIDVEVPIN